MSPGPGGAAAPPVGAGSGRAGEAAAALPLPPAAASCPRSRPALRWGCRRHGGVPGAPAGRAARQREGDRGPGPLLLQRGAAPSPGGAGDPRRGRVPGGAEEGAAPRFPLRPGAAGPAGRLAGLRRPPGGRQGGAGARRRDPLAGLLARVLGHRGAPAGLGLDRQDVLPRHQPGVPLHAPAQGGERAAPEGGGAGDDPAGAEGTARPLDGPALLALSRAEGLARGMGWKVGESRRGRAALAPGAGHAVVGVHQAGLSLCLVASHVTLCQS